MEEKEQREIEARLQAIENLKKQQLERQKAFSSARSAANAEESLASVQLELKKKALEYDLQNAKEEAEHEALLPNVAET